jgi:hypothetical protein
MSMKKHVCIILLLLVTFLLPLTFSHTVYSQETVSMGQVVSDTIPPNSYKVYYLSETLQKGSMFNIYGKIQEGMYGTLYLQRGSERLFSWMISKDTMTFALPFFTPTLIKVTGEEYLLNVTSGFGESLTYSFFYDFSQELHPTNTKSIPLEGGLAGYHIHLSSGDKVSLTLTSPSDSDFDAYVYSGPTTYLFFPPVAYTTSPTSPETLNFTAEHEGRHFIYVTSCVGTGSFNLTSSITPLAPTHEELQVRYDALSNELVNTRNLMYLFIITTIFFVGTTLYFAIRKPKIKQQTQ